MRITVSFIYPCVKLRHDCFFFFFLFKKKGLNLKKFRKQLKNHLGKDYSMHGIEIGSENKKIGYHGYIALTICVRQSELTSGYLVLESHPVTASVPMGRKLPGGLRAQNKGGVGLQLRYYETNLVFLTAHFSSDSGKNKH